MIRISISTALAAALLAVFIAPAQAEDAAKGRELFVTQCGLCHQGGEGDGEGGAGPSLRGLIGRKVGGDQDFPYTPVLANARDKWSLANLDAFLADPQKAYPGNSMPMNVGSEADRADLIAYLAALKPRR